jgi:hypothetical protein
MTCDSSPLTASIRASAAPTLRFRPSRLRLLFLRYQHVCACTGRSSWSFLHVPRLRCGLMQCPPRPSPHSRHTCCMFVIVDTCAEDPAETLIHELQRRTDAIPSRSPRITWVIEEVSCQMSTRAHVRDSPREYDPDLYGWLRQRFDLEEGGATASERLDGRRRQRVVTPVHPRAAGRKYDLAGWLVSHLISNRHCSSSMCSVFLCYTSYGCTAYGGDFTCLFKHSAR